MPPVRTAPRAAAPAANFVNFGDDSLYAGGFGLPEGDYALFFDVRMHANTRGDGSRGIERLVVMLSAYPLEGGDVHEVPLSMGSKAHLSFAPDPETGKRLVPIPGAQAASMAGMTNWNIFRKSMGDCDPKAKEVFANDISVWDGVWVHTMNIPEPEERKGFGANTGEVQPQRQGPQLIPVVTEIKEDGKPWEGGGGMPEGATTEARPTKPAPRSGSKLVAAPAKAASKKTVTLDASDPEQVMEAAKNGAAGVLETNPTGTTRLKLRIATAASVRKLHGDDMMQAVVDTFFGDDVMLGAVLGELGYALDGSNIVQA